MKSWMIYGAYGYTGKLLSQEAKIRGHSPVLAGRSVNKLIPLADELDLDYIVFDLEDSKKLINIIRDFELIFHAAGPYKFTSAPMVKACLKSGTNYLDITGELPIFEQNFEFDQQAKDIGIAIISGVGFDVVPTDCLAKYISNKIPNPTHLEVGIAGSSSPSAGTLKTIIEYSDLGTLIRKDGVLVHPEKIHEKKIQFSDKERIMRPVVWGDLVTAYRSTGIPNIITYMPIPKKSIGVGKSTGISKESWVSNENQKKLVREWIEKNVHGPDEQTLQTARSYLWAQVTNDKDTFYQAWLETIESYRFTAVAGVRAVEKLFKLKSKGALTPALAFGADFVLEIQDTKRFDTLN